MAVKASANTTPKEGWRSERPVLDMCPLGSSLKPVPISGRVRAIPVVVRFGVLLEVTDQQSADEADLRFGAQSGGDLKGDRFESVDYGPNLVAGASGVGLSEDRPNHYSNDLTVLMRGDSQQVAHDALLASLSSRSLNTRRERRR